MQEQLFNDTIAAISTGMVSAGLAVIRISGPRAVEIADAVVAPDGGDKLADRPTHTLCHGQIREGEETGSPMLISTFPQPLRSISVAQEAAKA